MPIIKINIVEIS